MGQAKRRGSYDARVKQAIEYRNTVLREYEAKCQERHVQERLAYEIMSETEYELTITRMKRITQYQRKLASLLCIAGSLSHGRV